MTIIESPPETEAPVAPSSPFKIEGLTVPAQEQTQMPPAPPVDPPQTLTDTAPPPEEPEPEEQQPAPILETAFIVYMNPQGHWMIANDIHEAAEMQIMRQSGVDDFFNGCSTVLRDIAVQETAATAVAMQAQALPQALEAAMGQMAEKARQAQMNAEIAKFAAGGKTPGIPDLSQLRTRG